MDLEREDELVSVKMASEEDHAMLVTAQGKSLRFSVRSLRSASRQSGGVRGIRLAKRDRVVGLEIAKAKGAMLVVTSQGFGKRTPVGEYPLQGRGGQGVITFKTNSKTGNLVCARMVKPKQELMLISEGGIVLRTAVEEISVQGRPTQGVTVMGVEEGDAVAAVTVVDMTMGPKEEGSLPTGVSAEPERQAGARKAATKAKSGAGRPAAAKGKAGPSAKGKAKPQAAPPKGKASTAKPAPPSSSQSRRGRR
jgi:DNA gyrase subunit A